MAAEREIENLEITRFLPDLAKITLGPDTMAVIRGPAAEHIADLAEFLRKGRRKRDLEQMYLLGVVEGLQARAIDAYLRRTKAQQN